MKPLILMFLTTFALATQEGAAVYEHPNRHFRILLPTEWKIDTSASSTGIIAAPLKSMAALIVESHAANLTNKSARDWYEKSLEINKGRYNKYKEIKKQKSVRSGADGYRVDYSFDDPFIHQAMRGWTVYLLKNGVINTVGFEASVSEYPQYVKAGEAALKSFTPSFVLP